MLCLLNNGKKPISSEQRNQALWELPWETYVLCPCFRASQSHVLKATHGQIGRETGRTLPGLSDAVDPDSLPRQLLESRQSLRFVVGFPIQAKAKPMTQQSFF